MKNNQYTATPNWFKDVQQQLQVVTTQTNYYIGGASGSGGLLSINLYNKFTIEPYRLTIDDLLIKNTAIIAADIPLAEGEERPEDFVSEIGKVINAENWYTCYLTAVVSGTKIIANLKANTNRYGIVFYDEYNQPISGYTPIKDELVTIDVPEKARYFRCCHYIEPTTELEESVEPTYEFYIEYTGIGSYNDSDLNTAYGGIFENFTNVNSSVPEGINTKLLSTSGLNLIFQQPLSCTVDKSNNIKIGLDKVFTDSKVLDLWKLIEDEQGNKYIITDYNVVGKGGITAYYNDDLNPGGDGGLGGGGSIVNIQIIGEGNVLSDVTLSEDKSLLTFTKSKIEELDLWKLIEDEQGNRYIVTDYNIVGRGGITAYYDGDLTPGSGGGLGGGTILDIEIKGEGNALINAYLNEDKSIITFEKKWLIDADSEQDINGIKNFTNGFKLNNQLINIIDGVLYLDCSIAVTGGITAYATMPGEGSSSIMDQLVVDTKYFIITEEGVLTIVPGSIGGISNIYVTGNGNALTTVTLSEDGKTVSFTKDKNFADQAEMSVYKAEVNQTIAEFKNDVNEQLKHFVTLDTEQEITAIKHFIEGVTIGSNKHKFYEKDGVLWLEGDIAITGGITTYATENIDVSTIMDGVTVDEVTLTKENGVIKIKNAGSGSSFDKTAMWAALSAATNEQINKSHLTTALSGYATTTELSKKWTQDNAKIANWDAAYSWGNHANAGYAKQTSLDAVSTKLNNFLEGSDTDTIINKWKELEAFLAGMSETDNLAEILSTKADKSYVDTELTKYVTLATEQTIDGLKHFTNGLTIGSTKHKIYEKDGNILIEGNVLVTGGITAYSDGSSSGGSGGGGIDVDVLWEILGGTGTQQINKTHLTNALSGYATENWVTSKNYAVKATTLGGYGITDGVNAVTTTGTGNAVTSASVSGHTLTLTKGSTFSLDGHTHTFLPIQDTRNENYNPYDGRFNDRGLSATHLKTNTVDGLNDGGAYHASIYLYPWRNPTGGPAHNLAFTNNGNMWLRSGTSSWNSWKKLAFTTDNVASATNADKVDNYHAGNASGQVAVSNGTLCTNLNADLLDGVHNGDLTAAYTHAGALTAKYVVTKNDNKGYPVYILIANCTSTVNTSSNGHHYGFTGIIIEKRINGIALERISKIIARIGYNVNSRYLQSDNSGIIPCIIKHGSNYYIALKVTGSRHELYFYGYSINLLSSFIQVDTTDSNGTLPSDYTVTYNGSGMNVYGNASSATKLQTTRYIWGQSFDGTANVVGALTNVTDITGSGTFNSANTKVTDSVYINGIRLYKSADGTLKLEGNLLVTGGITAYSTGEEGGGSSGGLDVNLLWEILGGTGTQQINITHLTDALTWNNISSKPSWIGDTKPSYNWSEIGNKPTTLGGYGITNAYTKTESDNRFVNVSGDTMIGTLTIRTGGDNKIIFDNTDGKKYSILSFRENGSEYGKLTMASDCLQISCPNNQIKVKGNIVWHAGNDGSGSGLDADLLDGYHRSNLYSSIGTWLSTVGLSKTITVTGDKNTYYPVEITVSSSKQIPTIISIHKDLGSTTPDISGNHNSGTSSLWLIYEMRKTSWDGNGGFVRTVYKSQPFATLVANAKSNTQNGGNLIVWLRGGTCSYQVSCTNTFTATPYYTTTNVSHTTGYTDNVSPTTSISNGGIFGGILWYGNVTGNAETATTATQANQLTTARAINGTAFNGTSNIVTSYWGTARTLSLTGNATGSVSMNGSSNVSMSVNVNYATSAGNADTVDSLHATAFARADQSPKVDLNTVNGKGIMSNPANANATTARHYPIQEAGTLFYGTAAHNSANQIYGTFSSNRWFFRGGGGSTTTKTAWKEMAFLTSNVASASKLQTSQTIWGRPFDGTAPVSGNMTEVGSITMNGSFVNNGGTIELYGKTPYIDFHYNSSTADYTSRLIAIGSNILQCTSNFVVGGNVGIGTTSPSYKLHVAGDIYATGWLRTNGPRGWYSQTYGGGWYMTDSTYIRTYGSKKVYSNNGYLAPYSGGMWITMATRTNIINGDQNQSTNSAHALYRVKTSGGHAVCFGGLGNEVGFYGFYKSRIDANENRTDWGTIWDSSNGTLTHRGNFISTGDIKVGSNYRMYKDSTGVLVLEGDIKVNGNILSTGGITAYTSSAASGTQFLYDVSSYDAYTSTSTTRAPSVRAVKLIKDKVNSVSSTATSALSKLSIIKSELSSLSSSSSSSSIGAALRRIADRI